MIGILIGLGTWFIWGVALMMTGVVYIVGAQAISGRPIRSDVYVDVAACAAAWALIIVLKLY